MSARVLNPTTLMSSEMTRRVGPNRAALARVRRDLFGPVDHAAARALAESELRAQSILDSERWGFDFRLEVPRDNSRYEWRIVGPQELVPEPYALRGMKYIRNHCPPTPKKRDSPEQSDSSKTVNALANIFLPNNETTPTHTTSPKNKIKSKRLLPVSKKQSSITGELDGF